MKKLLFISCVLVSLTGFTQITITESDFAVPGDTAMVSFSDETALDLVTTGANAYWDFSTINISAQTIDTFYAVQSADILYQLIFNNAWDNPDHVSDWYRPWISAGLDAASQFGVDIESPVRFTAVHPDRVENTGIGFEIMGTGIPGKSDTIDMQYQLPINYSDSWTSNSYTNIDLNPNFDAIYRRYQWRNSIVDGWGQILTPWGTFDAIRVKSLVQASDSIYIGAFSSWFELPTPDQVEYHWFTNGQKMPIFSVTTTDIGGNETITEVKFKDKKRYFASVEEELTFDGRIYPNPASNEVHIDLNSSPSLIEIFDLSGRKVYSKLPTESIVNINVNSWDPGVYVVRMTGEMGITSTRFVVE
ncbi:MAG: T9SS type A sorting domain-containing protein [Crocinitomicaceae bacterium]|nr:T9SS type A sorting domain-containing protein [Crocinitomicaceae bacterium]